MLGHQWNHPAHGGRNNGGASRWYLGDSSCLALRAESTLLIPGIAKRPGTPERFQHVSPSRSSISSLPDNHSSSFQVAIRVADYRAPQVRGRRFKLLACATTQPMRSGPLGIGLQGVPPDTITDTLPFWRQPFSVTLWIWLTNALTRWKRRAQSALRPDISSTGRARPCPQVYTQRRTEATHRFRSLGLSLAAAGFALLFAAPAHTLVDVLVNQVGYGSGRGSAIIEGNPGDDPTGFELIDATSGVTVLRGELRPDGPATTGSSGCRRGRTDRGYFGRRIFPLWQQTGDYILRVGQRNPARLRSSRTYWSAIPSRTSSITSRDSAPAAASTKRMAIYPTQAIQVIFLICAAAGMTPRGLRHSPFRVW